jgi:hypothetical protein
MTGDADPDALDRWERVQAIFGEALDLEAHARRDFLGRRCGEDSDLRAEVESLLEASRSRTPTSATWPTARASPSPLKSSATPTSPTRTARPTPSRG